MEYNAHDELETSFFLACMVGVALLTAGIGIALLARRLKRAVAVLAASAVVICIGLAVHFTVYGPVGDFSADALYAVLAYLAVSFVAPRVRSQVIAGVSFLVCAAIEVSQLSGGPAALAEVFPPARLILGTTFAPLDLVAYALGVGAALTCDLLIQRRPPRASTGAWLPSSGDAESR